MADFNDFLNFSNTDEFLNNISGSVSSLTPDSFVDDVNFDENKWELNNDFQQPFNDYTNETSTYQNGSDDNYSQPYNGSVSSTNDLTPISHPSYSSTHTSPENLKASNSSESINVKSKPGKIKKPKKDKTSHNMIEKKYRTNINSKILMLRDAVPALRIASGSNDIKVEDLEGLTPANKLNKASVLTKATEYIKHLEKKNEILKQQNLHLTKLIANANISLSQSNSLQSTMNNNVSPYMSQTNSMNSHIKPEDDYFDFSPNMNINSLDVSQASMDMNQQMNHQMNMNQMNMNQMNNNGPNKYLLGGIATVMGTSMFGGESDFRGLSAIPFFPISLVQSPIFIQFWFILKLLLIVGCLVNIFAPNFNLNFDVKKGESAGLLKTWVLVHLGLSLPKPIDDQRKARIVKQLLGKIPSNFSILFQDYLYLNTVETNFENILLNLLVGSILIKQYPVLDSLLKISMNLRYSLILNLTQESGDQGLIKLNQLIKQLDGVSLFKTDVITRLNNLMTYKPINSGIQDGDYIKYIEAYKSNNSLYSILFNWRIIEIMFDLNSIFLKNTVDEASNDVVLKDIKLLETLLSDCKGPVKKDFELFKTAIVPQENVKELMTSLKGKVDDTLNKFTVSLNGTQLTDTEISDDEIHDEQEQEQEESELESEVSDVFEDNVEQDSESDKETEVVTVNKGSKKLISSLNIISQDEFIILVTSLISHYNKSETKQHVPKLISYLSIDSIPSLLSFTCIFHTLHTLIPADDLEADSDKILDNLVRLSKDFLVKNKQMNHELRSQLNDEITKKGMVLNGGEN